MGPIRGGQKKKRKTESKAEPTQNNSMASGSSSGAASGSSEDVSTDWFDDVAERIASNLNLSPARGLDLFQTIFNMSRRTFEYVCSLAREHMILKTHYVFNNGQPLSLYDQVALALRRLSSGSSLIQIGDSFGVHHSTVSQVTWRFVEAMEVKGRQHLRWPASQQVLDDIKSQFEQIRGLPNCCGAIDITHILMLLSTSETAAHVWLDRKENHSMVLMGIVDPNMRFLEILTGLPGMLTDTIMLQNSKFFHSCQNGQRLNGEKLKLSERAEMQEYIIGDTGFPLLPWLMTPYQGKDLPEAKAEFNKRLMATRVVSQRAFARLKHVWKMIDGVMWRPDKHRLPRFIYVCCILHNIIIDMEDEVSDTLPVSQDHDPGYRMELCDYVDDTAADSRDAFSWYLARK
ncbi:OLC1v1004205C1 [Oldenlandia corymbosa var. corymbosa]|uniref:OLC1v1004205C1 n=1 Tax=Oldenlandia corymbosa var. corymbosa TaxID=529605 RepID=A0AAV1DCE6_OLDCO|nr:OLC1v1004205C1 [Oldenlandia corymbosa var. corymbosa]